MPPDRPHTPPIQARWNGARAQAGALRSYIELCEDNNPGASICVPPAPAPYYTFTLPPLFIHAMAMPLHLAVLSHRRFGLPLLGLVHLANRTEMLEPVAPTDPLDFECQLHAIEAHEKGHSFTLHTAARVGDRIVWREQSTYLYPVRTGPDTARTPRRQKPLEGEALAQWEVAPNAGRRFALPVRDFNPIHLSNWSARLLGQRQAIAHGLFSAARCLDVLRQHQPVPTPFVLDVQFKRPLPLPSTVALYARADRNGRSFELRVLPEEPGGEEFTHLVGSIAALRHTS